MYDLNLKIKNLDFEDDMVAAAFLSNLKYFLSQLGIDSSTIIGDYDKFPSVTCSINSLDEFRELFSEYSEDEIRSYKFNWHEVSKYQLSEDIIKEYKDYIKWDVLFKEYKKGNVGYDKNIIDKYRDRDCIDTFKQEINSDIKPIPIGIDTSALYKIYKKYMKELKDYSSYIDYINTEDDIEYVALRLDNVLSKIDIIHTTGMISQEQWDSQSIDYVDFKVIIQFCTENCIPSYDTEIINVKNILDKEEYDNLISNYIYANDTMTCIDYKYNEDDMGEEEYTFSAEEIINFIKSTKEPDEDSFEKIKYMIGNMTRVERDKFEHEMYNDDKLSDKFTNLFSIKFEDLDFDEALDIVVKINCKYINKPLDFSQDDINELEKVVVCSSQSSDMRITYLSYLLVGSIGNNMNVFDYVHDNYDDLNEQCQKIADLLLDAKEVAEKMANAREYKKPDNKPVNIETITTKNIASIFGLPDLIPEELWKKISNMNLSKEFIIQYRNKLDMKSLVSNPIFGKYMASDSKFFDMFIDKAIEYQAKKSDGSSLYRIKLDDLDI